ncbi:restriction endonuclease subunit S [Clostridiaceae bacterium OttesenSCG-928-D20]|nr:restriction endonuclease subunit S [Clostridiaceae bacterium OttesenSCG-928-D20]
MAKKKTQTLEEALVPESELPHAVPENWVWVKLPYAFINCTSSNKKIKQKDYSPDGIYAVVDQGKELIGGYTNDDILLYDGQLPVIIFGDHTRIIKYIEFPFAQGADGVKVLKPCAFWDNKCFYYNLQSVKIPDLGYRRHFPLFPQYSIPLPPLAEQRRIVARIESLFEKLDHARELVQTAQDSFETRKAAILHKAFTGELTAQWRAEHGVGMNSWEEMPFDKMCLSIYDGDHMPPPKKAEGIPFIVISNINQGYISLENTRFVPSDYYKSLSETRIPKRGDVLYSIVGSFGIPALVDIDEPFCFQRHIALFRPNSTVLNSKALWYILQTQEIYNLADNLATGTAQRTVPIRGLRKMLFMFPSLPEQQEIVRILDSLLEKEQKAKEQLEPVLDQIDLMKKSILARAFRGELGTNDPSEESALGLSEEILK